jgi:PAS domain S-box-containing protein
MKMDNETAGWYSTVLDNLSQGFCIIEIISDESGKAVNHRFLATNPEFERQTGFLNAVGKTARDFVPYLEDKWFELYDRVAKTGIPAEYEDTARNPYGDRWYRGFVFRIGKPEEMKLAVLFNNITEKKRYEANSDFLNKISFELLQLNRQTEIFKLACSAAGTFLKASQCHICEIDNESGTGTIVREWFRVRGRRTIVHMHRLSDLFRPDVLMVLYAGNPVIINDTALPYSGLKNNPNPSVRSYMLISVMQEGRLKYIFSIFSTDQRNWRNDETDLIRELSMRCWLRLQKISAEEQLHESEMKHLKNLEKEVADRTRELQESRDYIESIARITPDLITVQEAETGKVLFANKHNILEKNLPDKEILAPDVLARTKFVIHPADREKAIEFAAKRHHLSDDEILEADFRTRYKNKWEWINVRSKVFKRDEKGNAAQIITFTRDITEIKAAEKDAGEKDAYIRKITSATPDLMYIFDLTEKKIIYINRDIMPIIGFPAEVINEMGTNVLKHVIHRQDRKQLAWYFIPEVLFKEGNEKQFRVKDVKGGWQWYKLRETVFRTGVDGKPSQILGIAQNITKEKEAEVRYSKEKNRSDELMRLNALMDTFVFAAAHDLKGPVSNLKLLTSIIEDVNDSKQKLELQKKYSPAISRLEQTLNGLIKVLETEKEADSESNEVIFSSILDSIAEEFSREIKTCNPLINADFSACKSIRFIDSYMCSIFRNLIGNSLKYRKESRPLHIDIISKPAGRFVLLTFRDNGSGIDLTRNRKDLFKPFFRLSFIQDGSGVGLHIVKSIVTRNGGRITVESEPDQGTTFKVYLVPYSI